MRPVSIERALVAYLTSEVGVQTSTKVPNPRPDRFVRILSTGGSRLNVIESRPMVTVQAWGSDTGDAEDLAGDAWQAIDAMPLQEDLPLDLWVAEVRLSEPANLPDSESGQARYQFLAQIAVALQEAS